MRAARRVAVALALGLALAGCSGVSKVDFVRFYSRAGWQKPERVVAALDLSAGDRVADIGAGDGYFLAYLAEAVGPTGTVYAVDVDPKRIEKLQAWKAEGGHANVVVVHGEYEDPLLPDGEIDVVFLCNTYHHIEGRPAYFARLRGDLGADGRVAIVEPNAELGGVLSLFVEDGHASELDSLTGEMREAGYRTDASYDFLPVQIFEVYAPEADVG